MPGRRSSTGPAACSTGSARPTRPMPPTRFCWPARGRREIFTKRIFRGAGPVFRRQPVYCRDSARTSAGGRSQTCCSAGSTPEAAEALRALAGRMEGVRLVSSSGSCRRPLRRGRFQGRGPAGILPPGGVFPRGDPRAGGRGKRPFHAGNLRAALRAGGLGDLGQAARRARDRALRAGPARVRAQGPLPGGVKTHAPVPEFPGRARAF